MRQESNTPGCLIGAAMAGPPSSDRVSKRTYIVESRVLDKLSPPFKVAVIMTCFNRRESTLSSLRALFRASDPSLVHCAVFLVDDASSDGTAVAVSKEFPQVHVQNGTGDLYWNAGMRLAWISAMDTDPDFFLWLNDDLNLEADALKNLIACFQARRKVYGDQLIIVGRTVSPKTGRTTYGGYVRASRTTRLNFRHLNDQDSGDLCDTMNGNCVLMPRDVVDTIGISSEKFRHSCGDIDYGLRARASGYLIVQCPEPVGIQEKNEVWTRSNSRLNLENWRFILFHPKGIPLYEWFYFCRAHGGVLWPINFIWRYLKILRPFSTKAYK